MALFYQHTINESTKLAVWHIAETESFFTEQVPVQREITHPHKRLQHLAGRYILKHLFPEFPHHLIEIADTRKPFLANEEYHFSISHCGNYAAAIVSKDKRVGIDIELSSPKVEKIKFKFLNEVEMTTLPVSNLQQLTRLWSAKEAVFKWSGSADVDFREHILLDKVKWDSIEGRFIKNHPIQITVNFSSLDELTLAYIISP